MIEQVGEKDDYECNENKEENTGVQENHLP